MAGSYKSAAGVVAPGGNSTDLVTWVECPRDAWQGLAASVPTAAKALHLNNLLAAGFTHLDMGSFVSPRAVPQMADTEEVLEQLEAPPGANLLCIIGNERGLDRAVAAQAVTSVGYPLSVNDTFQRRNVGMSVADSWPLVESLLARAEAERLELVVYLSMGFGNPYGEHWDPGITADAVARLRQVGVKRIALADTVGNADAVKVGAVLAAVERPAELGLHLHALPGAWHTQLDVAVEHGVRWFEGALGGIGGCPFADDDLVGNLPTEDVIPHLVAKGLRVDVDLTALPALATEASGLARAAAD